MHLVSLNAGEGRPIVLRGQNAQAGEIQSQQSMGVAADRVLGDAQRGTEHPGLGQMVRSGRERKDEIAGGSDLRRERRQPIDVGFQMFQRFRAAHADEQSGAAGTDDAQRATRIEIVGGEC